MPLSFMQQYPATRAIIDAAEIAIEQPKNPDAQAETWSDYKGRNTVKFLLAVTPNGVPCFVSDCYGGRISDKELTKLSGLLGKTQYETDRLDNGDGIMVDRGFDIDDLLKGRDVQVYWPPFLRGRQQLTEEELVTTQRIASLRIHVQRAIERVKNFRILHFLPATMCQTATRLVRVCVFFTTLMPPLVPPSCQTDMFLCETISDQP